MIEPVARPFQSARPAGNRNAAVLAERTAAELRQVIQIQVDVISDIKVEVPVVVVIPKRRAGPPPPGIAHASLRGHVSERAIVVVMVENGTFKIGNIEIFPAVVVVVTYGHAESPPAMCQARLDRYIGEGAIVIVAIKLAGMALGRVQVLERRTVDQKNIHPAVVVIVEDSDAAAHRLHDVAFFRAAAGEMKINSSSACHIHKLR